MKKVLILFIGVFLSILLTCDKTEDDPDPDPTCSDGIKNGNETGIDCGGDCMPCFDCTTNYCAFLAGGLSSESKDDKKWISSDGKNISFTFITNGLVSESWEGENGSGYWKFDNQNGPSRIIITYTSKPDNWSPEFSMTLKKLTADSLIFTDQNAFKHSLVPE